MNYVKNWIKLDVNLGVKCGIQNGVNSSVIPLFKWTNVIIIIIIIIIIEVTAENFNDVVRTRKTRWQQCDKYFNLDSPQCSFISYPHSQINSTSLHFSRIMQLPLVMHVRAQVLCRASNTRLIPEMATNYRVAPNKLTPGSSFEFVYNNG